MITRSRCLRSAIAARTLATCSTPLLTGGRFVHASPTAGEEVKPAKRETIAPPRSFNNGVQSNRIKYLNAIKKDLGDKYADTQVETKLLLDSLKNMQAWRSWTPSGTHHAVAFKDAHRNVSQLTSPGQKLVSVGDLERVITPEAGVVWRMIHQVIKEGQPRELAALDEKERAMVLFSRVHGLGSIYAQTFVDHGARTLEDLAKAEDKQFGRKVSKAQLLAIKHFVDMEKLIPRIEVDEIREEFGRILTKKVDSKFKFEVMGSYRRGARYSSDVDIVVYHPSYNKPDRETKPTKDEAAKKLMDTLRQELIEEGFLEGDSIFSSGNRKIIALTKAPSKRDGAWRQDDIRLCPKASVPYMLVGNTGDMQLMKMLRGRAMEKGLTLNEYGMGQAVRSSEGKRLSSIKAGTEVPAKKEEDIFKHLGLPYLKPEQRSFSHYKTIPAYSKRIPKEKPEADQDV